MPSCPLTSRLFSPSGYIVFSGPRRANGVQGLRFIIQSEKAPHYLESRVEAFLCTMEKAVEEMGEEAFQKHIQALAIRRLDKPKKLSAECSKHWGEIISQQYHFDRGLGRLLVSPVAFTGFSEGLFTGWLSAQMLATGRCLEDRKLLRAAQMRIHESLEQSAAVAPSSLCPLCPPLCPPLSLSSYFLCCPPPLLSSSPFSCPHLSLSPTCLSALPGSLSLLFSHSSTCVCVCVSLSPFQSLPVSPLSLCLLSPSTHPVCVSCPECYDGLYLSDTVRVLTDVALALAANVNAPHTLDV